MTTTTKAAHTPGPWRIVKAMNDAAPYVAGEQSCDFVADMLGKDGHYDAERMAANARLIAAAPEMLEALEEADLRCTQAKIASTIGKKANQADFLRGELERIQAVCVAAIQKAKGGQ